MIHFDFNFGADIQCTDEQCGKLAGLVIDPEFRHVTDLIVRRGYLVTQDRVVPISVVENALDETVSVSARSHELDQYPEYRVVEHEEPVSELEPPTPGVAMPYGVYGAPEPTAPTVRRKIREGIPPERKVVERGLPVHNLEGKIGKVDRVVVNHKRKEIIYLVARRGLIFSDRVVIPISMVERVYEDGILITGTNEALAQLPRYDDMVVEADL